MATPDTSVTGYTGAVALVSPVGPLQALAMQRVSAQGSGPLYPIGTTLGSPNEPSNSVRQSGVSGEQDALVGASLTLFASMIKAQAPEAEQDSVLKGSGTLTVPPLLGISAGSGMQYHPRWGLDPQPGVNVYTISN